MVHELDVAAVDLMVCEKVAWRVAWTAFWMVDV